MLLRQLPKGPTFAVAVFLIALGCSSKDRWQAGRPPVYPSSGMITYEGKPLENAIITLLPKAGNQSAFSRSDAAGHFQLTTFDDGDGAVAGDYDVKITCLVVENDPDPNDPEHRPPLHHAEYSIIPELYYDAATSGLSVTIPEGGTDKLTLELTGKPLGKFDKGTPKYRKAS